MRTTLIIAGSLLVLAFACKLLIPSDLAWRIPGGWPFGSRYYRPDTVAFWFLLGASAIVLLIALVRGAGARS